MSGELKILGVDVAADPQQVQDRIGYMPQKFGLYEDLSVQENLDSYADLHGVTAEERRERYPRLMEMTALGPFTQPIGRKRLSGGMKQKLGLSLHFSPLAGAVAAGRADCGGRPALAPRAVGDHSATGQRSRSDGAAQHFLSR